MGTLIRRSGRIAIATTVIAVCAGMASPGAGAIGKHLVGKRGTLEAVHVDSGRHSRYVFTLVTPNRRLDLAFSGRRARAFGRRATRHPDRYSGARVSARGRIRRGKMTVRSIRIQVSAKSLRAAAPPLPLPQRPRKVAVILFNFQNATGQPISVDQARSRVFTAPNSANAFYKEESANRISLTGKLRSDGDVFGWVTIPRDLDSTCGVGGWSDVAKAMLESQGNDLSGYDHYMYVTPVVPGCGAQGRGAVSASWSWVSSSTSLGAWVHELGHNLGMLHANDRSCVDGNGETAQMSPACNNNEYGDPYDVMGGGGEAGNGSIRENNNFYKGTLGILTGTTQTVTRSGQYTVGPSTPGYTGVQAVRVKRPSVGPDSAFGTATTFYYLEFRQPSGMHFDNFDPTDSVVNGVTVRIAPDYGWPGPTYTVTGEARTHPSVPAGQSYVDPVTGITIKTLSVSPAGATVKVTYGNASQSKAEVTNGGLKYTAGYSQVNHVTVSGSGSSMTLTDASSDIQTINAGGGCSRVSGDAHSVTCTRSAGFNKIQLDLGDRNDSAVVNSAVPAEIQAGEGDDTLRGGRGGDVLSGGPGADKAEYSDRTAPVRADLAVGGQKNDGEAGEGDDVGPDVENVDGGSGADTLIGTDQVNSFFAGAGDDHVSAGAGADQIAGGPGNDFIDGGLDADTIVGDDGFDWVDYSSRTAPVTATLDFATLYDDGEQGERDWLAAMDGAIGGSGSDTLTGRSVAILGSDQITDALVGCGGDDTVDGGAGDDIVADGLAGMCVGGGSDSLTGGLGSDWILGGGGFDSTSYAGRNEAISVDLADPGLDGGAGDGAGDTISNIGAVFGGSAANTITGNDASNILVGSNSNDLLNGKGGNDWLIGAGGADTINGGGGPDQLDAGAGDDQVHTDDDGGTPVQDTASCGTGTGDVATADQIDRYPLTPLADAPFIPAPHGCETLTRH